MNADAARPAAPSPFDRVMSLCESDEERAEIQRLCIEFNLGTHGAELTFMLLDMQLAAMRARRVEAPITPAQPAPVKPTPPRSSPVTRLRMIGQPRVVSIDRRYGLVAVGVVVMLVSWFAGHSVDAVALLLVFAVGLAAGVAGGHFTRREIER